MRIKNQGIAGNPCGFIHGAAETAINYKQPSFCPDRIFPFNGMDWCMSIDDMGIVIIKSKFMKYLAAKTFIIILAVIRIWLLCPQTFFIHIFTFKSLKFSSTQRRLFTAPQKPHEINIIFVRVVQISSSCFFLALIQQRFSMIIFSINAQFIKGSVFINRNTPVIN